MYRILILGIGLLTLVFVPAARADTQTFGPTGGEQLFTVPSGVTTIGVVATGATGGTHPFGDAGGRGAQVTGTLAVAPGQQLFVEVGTTGGARTVGFNGGGSSRGGGASDIRTASRLMTSTFDSRVIVAAGGGGGGQLDAGHSPGLDADVPTGSRAAQVGRTATQSGPGAGGIPADQGNAGSAGVGADGGNGAGDSGGGGGGLNGGGGGGNGEGVQAGGGGGFSKVPGGGEKALAAAATASVTITFTPPAAGSTPAGVTPVDKTSPVLSKLSMSPTSFSAANFGAALIAKVGTKVSYRESEVATTTFTVQRVLKGRKKGKKCKVGRRKGKRCTIYKKLKGSFKHTDVAGVDRFRFQGRIGGKALKKGSYRLVGVSQDRAGNKAKRPAYRSFRIK